MHRSLGTVNGAQVTGSSATHPQKKKENQTKDQKNWRPEEPKSSRAAAMLCATEFYLLFLTGKEPETRGRGTRTGTRTG